MTRFPSGTSGSLRDTTHKKTIIEATELFGLCEYLKTTRQVGPLFMTSPYLFKLPKTSGSAPDEMTNGGSWIRAPGYCVAV